MAALVCPSAPFLAPRLLCAPTLSAATYATKAGVPRKARDNYNARGKKPEKGENGEKVVRRQSPAAMKWKAQQQQKNQIFMGQLSFIEQFHAACEQRNITKIMDLYPNVLQSPLRSRDDTRRLAQALHAHIRNQRPRDVPQEMDRLVPFLALIKRDLQSGALPPHPAAHVHILGIYKEGKRFVEGHRFWQWLADQDDSFLDQAVYGAAIELLTYRGQDSLEALEELYQDALKRFPGTFAEYHLSPDAVVQDRAQPTTIAGMPVALLQGILTARIFHRDWKNAYLALDIALRLYPNTLPPRFFELFIEERSLQEAYTVFHLACRAGVLFKPSHLTALLSRLKSVMNQPRTTLEEKVILVRGMANAIYAYLESGGSLQGPHVGAFLNAFGLLLPHKPYGEEWGEDAINFRNQIVTCVHAMSGTLMQIKSSLQTDIFVAMINLAGRYKVRELLDVMLEDVEKVDADLGHVGRRIVLQTAGEFRDRELIEKAWAQIVTATETAGRQLEIHDWVTLARVCRRAGFRDFFDQQLQSMQHAIDTTSESTVIAEANKHEPRPKKFDSPLMDSTEFSAQMEEIEKIMSNVTAVVMSGSPLDIRKTPFSMFLDYNRPPIGPESTLRAVYDEFTIDPHMPPLPKDATAPSAPVPMSSTGIPLEELRFLNWVTVVELMHEARAAEMAFQQRVEQAMSRGKPLEAEKVQLSQIVRLNTARPGKQGVVRFSHANISEFVRELRAPYQPDQMGRPQPKPTAGPVRRVLAKGEDPEWDAHYGTTRRLELGPQREEDAFDELEGVGFLEKDNAVGDNATAGSKVKEST